MRVRAAARDNGPALFDRFVTVGPDTHLTFDLHEAAGDRLDFEFGVLPGNGAVELERAELIVPGTFKNLILIVIDTLRADRVHDPDDRVATPSLDALGAAGVSLSRAYSHASTTLPSHTALFSSRLPSETGVLSNAMQVPGDLPLLAPWMAGTGLPDRCDHQHGHSDAGRTESWP